MNKIAVFSLDKRFKSLEKDVKRLTGRAIINLKKDRVSVDIYLVSDQKIRSLNRKFRGQDKVTSVLSFEEPKAFPHPERRGRSLGEIYIAPDYIRRKGEDMTRPAVHGLLHLLGYTHAKKGDRMRMEKKEAELLSRIPNL